MESSPLNYTALLFTFLGAWLFSMNKENITFIFTVVSGLSATLSFLVRTWKEYKEIRRQEAEAEERRARLAEEHKVVSINQIPTILPVNETVTETPERRNAGVV